MSRGRCASRPTCTTLLNFKTAAQEQPESMAHLAASWPDQVLCKENKRRALDAQHASWMRQRERELQKVAPTQPPAPVAAPQAAATAAALASPVEPCKEEEELDEINAFLDSVGRSLGDA